MFSSIIALPNHSRRRHWQCQHCQIDFGQNRSNSTFSNLAVQVMEGIDWWMTLSLFVEVRFSIFFFTFLYPILTGNMRPGILSSCGKQVQGRVQRFLAGIACDKNLCLIQNLGNELSLKRTCVVFVLQPILDLVTKEMPAYDDIIRAMCNEKVHGVLIYHNK